MESVIEKADPKLGFSYFLTNDLQFLGSFMFYVDKFFGIFEPSLPLSRQWIY